MTEVILHLSEAIVDIYAMAHALDGEFINHFQQLSPIHLVSDTHVLYPLLVTHDEIAQHLCVDGCVGFLIMRVCGFHGVILIGNAVGIVIGIVIYQPIRESGLGGQSLRLSSVDEVLLNVAVGEHMILFEHRAVEEFPFHKCLDDFLHFIVPFL